MFQLSDEEFEELKSQYVISKRGGIRSFLYLALFFFFFSVVVRLITGLCPGCSFNLLYMGLTFILFFVKNLIMETKDYAQQIVDELVYLPKEKIIEVADFVHFLREKVQHGKTTLHEAGLTRAEALDLKRRLSTFEDDWNIPDMDAYDNL